jgi:hypothetical protein
MTSSMTLFWPKILSMADSFDSISTNINIGECSTYQIVRKIYATKFGQPVCFTMTRSLRSKTPLTCAVLKRKGVFTREKKSKFRSFERSILHRQTDRLAHVFTRPKKSKFRWSKVRGERVRASARSIRYNPLL